MTKRPECRIFVFYPGLVRSNLRGISEEVVTAQDNAGDPMELANAIMETPLSGGEMKM